MYFTPDCIKQIRCNIIINLARDLHGQKMKNRKVYIQKELGHTPEKMKLLSEFCLFCAKVIPIQEDFSIWIVSDREKCGISTTAAYVPGRKMVLVYGKGRSLVDVCRSIAHEMVHMAQDEKGQIQGEVQDIGGFHENQANAGAGALIKAFAQSQPQGRMIYESRKKRIKNLIFQIL